MEDRVSNDGRASGVGGRLRLIEENKRLGKGKSKEVLARRKAEREQARERGLETGRRGHEVVKRPCIGCEKMVWCLANGVYEHNAESVANSGLTLREILELGEDIDIEGANSRHKKVENPVCDECRVIVDDVRASQGLGAYPLGEIQFN